MTDKEESDTLSNLSPEMEKEVVEYIAQYLKNNPQFKNHYLQILCKNNHYTTYYVKPEDTLKVKMENSLAKQFCPVCNGEVLWTNEVDPAIHIGYPDHIPIMVELGNYENMDKYDRSLDVHKVPTVGTCKKTDAVWSFEVDDKTYESSSFDEAVKLVIADTYFYNPIYEINGDTVDVVFANERLVEEIGFGKFSLVVQEKERYYYYVF